MDALDRRAMIGAVLVVVLFVPFGQDALVLVDVVDLVGPGCDRIDAAVLAWVFH
ncbi:hypothetical protein D3C83_138530 [compost metagenome]